MVNKFPPPILDCSFVLSYAIHDESVNYTGKLTTYVDGKLVGPEIKRSAICKNLTKPNDYLYLYCDENWRAVAAAGYGSLEDALESAEKRYSGISEKLTSSNYSEDNLEEYLDDY